MCEDEDFFHHLKVLSFSQVEKSKLSVIQECIQQWIHLRLRHYSEATEY